MAVTAVWAAVLITYGVSIGIALGSAKPGLNEIQLDVAPNSVDDMYDGCKDKMKFKVEKEYLQTEKNKDTQFKKAWDEAEKKFKTKKERHPPMWKPAIYVYTLDNPKIYLDFNNAVRTQRFKYNTTFKYHTLHFFLTDALQRFNARKPKTEQCLTSYRRVNSYFSEDVLNKEIRFGSFTSSSRNSYPSIERFGDKSCFNISTCFGADVSLYSRVESEAEILIPPYEVFNVTNIERRSDQNRSEQDELPCEVVYTVKSTQKTLSNLNCALIQK